MLLCTFFISPLFTSAFSLLFLHLFFCLLFCILLFITSSGAAVCRILLLLLYYYYYYYILYIIMKALCSMRRWWYAHACTKVHSFTQYFVSIAVAIFRTRVPRTKRSLKIHTRNQRRERLLGELEQGGNCSILLRGNPFLTIW